MYTYIYIHTYIHDIGVRTLCAAGHGLYIYICIYTYIHTYIYDTVCARYVRQVTDYGLSVVSAQTVVTTNSVTGGPIR